MAVGAASVWEWSGGAKVSCILRHRDVQLILAYSWARPAILIAGEGGCFYFFCFFTFIHIPYTSLFPSFISSLISSVSFLRFSGRRHEMTPGVDVSLNPNTSNHRLFQMIYHLSGVSFTLYYPSSGVSVSGTWSSSSSPRYPV